MHSLCNGILKAPAPMEEGGLWEGWNKRRGGTIVYVVSVVMS